MSSGDHLAVRKGVHRGYSPLAIIKFHSGNSEAVIDLTIKDQGVSLNNLDCAGNAPGELSLQTRNIRLLLRIYRACRIVGHKFPVSR